MVACLRSALSNIRMEVALVYPHQLFRVHPALADGRDAWLIEDPLFFGNDPHWPAAMHRQKLVLHRASMKAYAAELEAAGHRVTYLDTPAGSRIDSAGLLESELPQGVTEIHLADPADDILMRRVRRLSCVKMYLSLALSSPPADLVPN